MTMCRLLPLLASWIALLALSTPARAIEVKVSAEALERTLKAQLFNSPDARHYIRGSETAACSVYADNPRITFKDDRVVVRIHTLSKLGTAVHGACIGLTLSNEAVVSLIPEAQGESVGFRDARIESLSGNKELDFLLVPFLSRKLPSQMKVNAAALMRTLLIKAPESTGYTLTLKTLKLHSMLVDQNALVVDLDATLDVD
jgi:hypothetical protein